MIMFFCMLLVIVVFEFISPWWWGFTIGVLAMGTQQKRNALHAFVIGFLAGFMVWLCLTWYYDHTGILADRISVMFSLQSSIWLRLLTGLIGGILAGMASMTGFLGRQWIMVRTNHDEKID